MIALALVLAWPFAVPPGPPPAAAAPVSAEATPLALVFQATSSRGPHQAGMAYAILATHRDAQGHRLPIAGVSGASVGGLNALLTALLACTPELEVGHDPALGSGKSQLFQVDGNPLYDVWGDLDWQALFPGDRTCDAYRADFPHLDAVCDGDAPWRPGDGLLSTNGLSDLMRLLERRLTEDGYLPGCRVPLSVTLAAEDPLPLPIARGEARISVPAARRQVRLVLETTAAGRLRICQPLDAADGDDRFALRLPINTFEPDCDRIDPAELLAVVRASALPPPLLPPQPIDHCSAEPCTYPGAGRGHCRPGFNQCRARFTDAFLLDPVPLAAVLAPGPRRIVLLDPEGGRGPAPLPYADRELAGTRFLRPYALDTLLPVVTGYELQTLRRYERIPPETVVDTYQGKDRLYGDFAYGFAALVHPALRRFDFYRGVVDGLRRRARERCPQAEDTACRERCWHDLLAEVGVERSPGLGYVLYATLVRDQCGSDQAPPRCVGWQAALAELRSERFSPQVQPFHTLFTVLEAFEAGRTGPQASRPLRLSDFVAVMEDVHRRAVAGDSPRYDLTGPPFGTFGHFWYDGLRQLGERLSVLEVRDGDAGLRQAVDLGTFVMASRAESLARGFRAGSVSIPEHAGGSAFTGGLARVLSPWRIAAISPGGVQLDWDGLTWADRHLHLVLLGAGLHYDSDGPTGVESLLVGLTPQVGWRSDSGEQAFAVRMALAGGRHVTSEPLVGPLHLGVELIYRWRALALGVGSASLGCGVDCHDPRAGRTWTQGPLFVSVGLADVGGLLWGLGRTLGGGERPSGDGGALIGR